MISSGEMLTDPNLAYLDAELRLLTQQLETLAAGGDVAPGGPTAELERHLNDLRGQAAAERWLLMLPHLADAFRLSEFETRLLLLAAAPEIEAAFGDRIARALGSNFSRPTVALAWKLYAGNHQRWLESRDSLRADAPLFRWELLYLEGDAPLPECSLRADRRVVDALLGRTLPDARLARYIRSLDATGEPADSSLNPAIAAAARCIATHLSTRVGTPLVLQLFGSPVADLEVFAARAVRGLGLPILAAVGVPAHLAIPALREPMLLGRPLCVSQIEFADWAHLVTGAGPVLFFASEQELLRPAAIDSSSWIPVDVARPDSSSRAGLWSAAFADLGIVDPPPRPLPENFAMSASEIRQAAQLAANRAWLRGETPTIDDVFRSCRSDAHHRMTEVSRKLTASYRWEDLLVPAGSAGKLRELCGQVQAQQRVLESYGFAPSMPRGRGVTALFSGPSGTGKTMAAEVIAGELKRELYRVDLARVVSKYIGETEKNLQRIFQEAERARCVVLFDEADALFARRLDAHTSIDKYSNLEVSWILQLVEESENAVILLASNRREAIDEAFLRRFRFIIEFPMPDAALRRELWRRSFPAQVALSDVSFDALAERLPISGASIRNIALAASFMAANDGGVVHAGFIAQAARREMEKMGRPVSFGEHEFAVRKASR